MIPKFWKIIEREKSPTESSLNFSVTSQSTILFICRYHLLTSKSGVYPGEFGLVSKEGETTFVVGISRDLSARKYQGFCLEFFGIKIELENLAKSLISKEVSFW